MEPTQRSAPNAPKMNPASRKKFLPTQMDSNFFPITHQKRGHTKIDSASIFLNAKVQATAKARLPTLSINTALASSEKPLSMERGKSPPPNFKD